MRPPELGILCELQALNGGLALFRNVADDVRDRVRLVLEVTVRDIDECLRRHASARESEVLDEPGIGLLHACFCITVSVISSQNRLGAGRKYPTLSDSRGLDLLLGGKAGLDFGSQLVGGRQRLDEVLHVVVLARDQAAQVQDHAAGLVALPDDGHVGVLQSVELLPVPLALPLQLFRNLLLEHKRLQGVVTLLLGARQAVRQPRSVLLLLVKEAPKAPVLALVALNLDLELLSLLGECIGKCLELEELYGVMLVTGSNCLEPKPSLIRTCCFQLSSSSLR